MFQLRTHVYPHHAVLIPFVACMIQDLYARALQITLVAHQIADPNVLLTQNVRAIWPASATNAKIHAMERADQMHNVTLYRIVRDAIVLKALLVIHSPHATKSFNVRPASMCF